jgi:predicted Fe-Mo cluster-binding NifX family protein
MSQLSIPTRVLKYLGLLLLCPLPIIAFSLPVTLAPARVAIPANGPGLDAAVSSTFSRGRYFVIVDLQTQRRMVRENPHWSNSQALGVHSADVLVEAKVGTVIVNRIGPAPLGALTSRGVRVLTGSARTVQEALDLYLAGQLSELEQLDRPGPYGRGQGPRWAEVPMGRRGAQGAALRAPAAAAGDPPVAPAGAPTTSGPGPGITEL